MTDRYWLQADGETSDIKPVINNTLDVVPFTPHHTSAMSLHRPVPQRVGQLDASALDSELYDLLKTRLLDSFTFFGQKFRDSYEPELHLLLKLALFKVTVWDHSTTYGAKLQNLVFLQSKSRSPITKVQKLLYCLLVVGGSYGSDKINQYLTTYASFGDEGHVGLLRKITDRLNTLSSGVSVVNFLLFLYSGKYSTFILRLLRIDLAPTSKVLNRQPNLEFQNRQLVWNALTEFLIFVLPLIDIVKLRKKISRRLMGTTDASNSSGLLSFLPEKTCAICYQQAMTSAAHTDITNPYAGECGHIYCYICIKTSLADDGDGFNCLRCNALIKTANPYRSIHPAPLVNPPDTSGEQPMASEKPLVNSELHEDIEESSDEEAGYDLESAPVSMNFVVED